MPSLALGMLGSHSVMQRPAVGRDRASLIVWPPRRPSARKPPAPRCVPVRQHVNLVWHVNNGIAGVSFIGILTGMTRAAVLVARGAAPAPGYAGSGSLTRWLITWETPSPRIETP